MMLAVTTAMLLLAVGAREDAPSQSGMRDSAGVGTLDGRAADGVLVVDLKTDATPTQDAFLALSVDSSGSLASPAIPDQRVAALPRATAEAPTAAQVPAPPAIAQLPPAAIASPQLPAPAAEPVVRAAAVAPASRYATRAEMEQALGATPWPAELWPKVITIAFCEAGIDSDRDGHNDMVDTFASGAGGRYIGAMQIGSAHGFATAYDLRVLKDNFLAAFELWAAAGDSFSPWGCR